MMRVAFDTETKLMGPGAMAPDIICGSFAWRDPETEDILQELLGNHPDDDLEGAIEDLLQRAKAGEIEIVTHNGAFDWAVVCANYPRLIPLVFDVLIAGRATDTLWREKLLNLSTTGKLENLKLPDGSNQKIRYALADLERRYMAIDRSEDKDGEDVWRMNYEVLDGWLAAEYPEDAAEYANDDARNTLVVSEHQDAREEEFAIASLETEHFQLASSFALFLMTCWGAMVDHEQVEIMRVEVERRLAEVEPTLIEAGILTPALPSSPYAGQLKRAQALITEHAPGTTFEESREMLEAHGIKFKAAQKSKQSDIRLQDYVRELYRELGEIPDYTGSTIRSEITGEQEKRICLEDEVTAYLAGKDELMAAYRGRKVLQKLVTNQIPVMLSGDIIYPSYDVLKETGRTSSFDGGKRGKGKNEVRIYPSTNIQQVPNEIEGIDPRKCYIPRPGRCFFDVDYTALELACVGQVTYDLFGESVHLARYNEGYDLHAYLGGQLLVKEGKTTGQEGEFNSACRAEGIISDPIAVYHAFKAIAGEGPEWKAFYKHRRNFAKPVGLGFPGGLGPATMVEFARKTYGVILTEDQAREFRELWYETYPEMPLYFQWVNGQIDNYNVRDDGQTVHYYETPLGMIRRGATFCATANGKCMQSPGAEGAKIAMIQVQRECYDPTQESVLFGCRPIAFVHDQVVGETTTDQSLWHDQAMRVRDIMCDSMKYVLPDIRMRSDEAHLTSVWSKSSEPVFDSDKRLIPWQPAEAA